MCKLTTTHLTTPARSCHTQHRKRKIGAMSARRASPFSLSSLHRRRRMRAHHKVNPTISFFFLSPFPTCSSHLWPRSFNSKIDVTACVLGLISLLNHVRCSRASNDRYSIQEKKHFYTQPPVSTFCVVATFFFLSLSPHTTIS